MADREFDQRPEHWSEACLSIRIEAGQTSFGASIGHAGHRFLGAYGDRHRELAERVDRFTDQGQLGWVVGGDHHHGKSVGAGVDRHQKVAVHL